MTEVTWRETEPDSAEIEPSESKNIVPHYDGLNKTCGTPTQQWIEGHFNKIYIYDKVKSNLIPEAEVTLGEISSVWYGAYIGDLLVTNESTFMGTIITEGNVIVASNLLFCDSSEMKIGVGTNTPTKGKLEVFGEIAVSGDGNALKLYYGSYSVGLMAPYGLNADSGYTLPAAIGQIGQVLAIQAISAPSIGALGWVDAATGNVTGPDTATDNAVARFNSTSGKAIKNGVVTITDAGDISGAHDITASGDVTVGASGSLIVSGDVGSNLVPSLTSFNLGAAA